METSYDIPQNRGETKSTSNVCVPLTDETKNVSNSFSEIERKNNLSQMTDVSPNEYEYNLEVSRNDLPHTISVDDYSPRKWSPQADEFVSCSSKPFVDNSLMNNSFVTAYDKTPNPCKTGTMNGENSNSQPSIVLIPSSPSTDMSASSSTSILLTPSTDRTPSDETPSMMITSSEDHSLTPSLTSFQRDSSGPYGGDSDEEYFEEYHLPNTHENAFVRHLSFRRKVQTTPIDAPDAERIEGLVRTGEFARHGSLRKRILPEEEEEYDEEIEEEEEFENEDYDKADDGSNFSKRFERGIREISRYLSDEQLDESIYAGESVHRLPRTVAMPKTSVKSKQTASTPKKKSESDTNDCNVIYNPKDESFDAFEANVNIEDSTLRKIKECLDFSSYKDILNLSGRLSDLLSPKEVEDVLLNAERYRQYLNSDVFEALSLSYQGQSRSLPYNLNVSVIKESDSHLASNSQLSHSNSNKSLPHTDSGFSSPRTPKVVETKQLPEESSDPQTDCLVLVRRNAAACGEIGAQGIFLETPAASSDLKKISAPVFNLDWSSETKFEDSDILDPTEISTTEDISTTRKMISVTEGILEVSDIHEDGVVASEAMEYLASDEGLIVTRSRPPLRISEIDNHHSDLSILPPPPDLIPELTAAEELSEVRHWRNVVIGGAWRRIDMKVIAPYRKCISHGGYMEENKNPIVVIGASLLPERSRKDYNYVMDNLFMYVLSFLEQLVADDYVLVYFSGGLQRKSGPGFHWMRKAYEMIDRRLRKNLKSLLVVHPSLWSRTIVALSRPFVSSKFYRKLKFVYNLTDLAQLVPLEQLEIPDGVKQADFEIMIKEKKKLQTNR